MVDDHYIDALPPGYRIREYEIRRVLGRGGSLGKGAGGRAFRRVPPLRLWPGL